MHLRLNTELLSGLFGLALTALFFFNRGDVGFLSSVFPNTVLVLVGAISAVLLVRGFFCRGTNHAVIRRCRLCADRGWCDGGVVAWHQACRLRHDIRAAFRRAGVGDETARRTACAARLPDRSGRGACCRWWLFLGVFGRFGHSPVPRTAAITETKGPRMPRVVISEFMDEPAIDWLRARHDVTYDPSLVDDPSRLRAACADADALIVRNRTQVDAALMDAAPALRAIGRLGVGLDNIDTKGATARGVAVFPGNGRQCYLGCGICHHRASGLAPGRVAGQCTGAVGRMAAPTHDGA